MRGRRAAAVTVVVAAVAALVVVRAAAEDWERTASEPSIDAKLEPSEAEGSLSGEVGATQGVAGVFMMAHITTGEPVVIESVKPVKVDPGVTVETSRIIFIGPVGFYAGRVATNGGIGQTCEPWPPAGFGPTYWPEGLHVPAKGRVKVVMWATTTHRSGQHGFEGVEVRLRRPGGRGTITLRNPHGRHVLRTVPPEEFRDPDATYPWCRLDDESPWSKPWPGIDDSARSPVIGRMHSRLAGAPTVAVLRTGLASYLRHRRG